MTDSIDLLEAALKPLTIADLQEHYSEGKCLVLEGSNDKFTKLVTPADIERRLNDGCNANTFAPGNQRRHTQCRCKFQCGLVTGGVKKNRIYRKHSEWLEFYDAEFITDHTGNRETV